jgi:hypothetical protein
VSLRGGEADVAISYKETESEWQITESRKCIVRNLQTAIRKPLLFQEIATAGQPASVVGGWSLVVRKKPYV